MPFESPDGQFVYYLKRPPIDGIPFSGYGSVWRTPTGGGEPSKVLERVWARNYALTPRGIYFLEEAAGEGTSADFAFRFLDLESGEIRTEVILPPDVAPGHTFAISPDERTLLYTCFRTVGADLVLVENFR